MTKSTTDVESAVNGMSAQHLHCRDYGHTWKSFTARFLPEQHAYEQTLRCARCRTTRARVLNIYGEVVTSSYTYAEGYQIHGLGRLSGSDRGLVRIASVLADMQKAV